jgi:membrane-bound lytic murein transglycosylase B
MIRHIISVLTLTVALGHAAFAAPPWVDPNPPPVVEYKVFLDQLWRAAQKQGITRATFDLAFTGVTLDPRVMPITKRQPEYGKPAGAYVNSIASPGRAKEGVRKATEWSKTFDEVEKKYKVERWIIQRSGEWKRPTAPIRTNGTPSAHWSPWRKPTTAIPISVTSFWCR